MKKHLLLFTSLSVSLFAQTQTPGLETGTAAPSSDVASVEATPPLEWIDPATGHRVVRLSREPGTASLYFHQNAYTPEGDKLIVTTPRGLAAIDLVTGMINDIIEGDVRVIVVGRTSRQVYYTTREEGVTVVSVAHVDTGEIRRIASLPMGASVASVNADETLLLGSLTERPARPLVEGPAEAARGGARPQGEWMRETHMLHPVTGAPLTFAEQKEWRLNDRLESRLPMEIFVIDVQTGERRPVHRATDWLNHLQFSPTDPGQIMFCHEGPLAQS